MDTGIGKVVKDGGGNAIIFTALLAAIVANVLPTPADVLFFNAQSSDKTKLENGQITPKQYWMRDMLGYYGYTASWYLALFIILQAAGGSYKNNARILIAVLSAGLIVGVFNKNVKKDNELEDLKKQQQDALAKKLGVPTCALYTTPVASACAPVPAVCTTDFKSNS